MFKQSIALLMISTLLGTTAQTGLAGGKTKAEKDAEKITKMKEKILKMGTGENARITVGLKSKEPEIKGFISEAGEESFSVTNLKSQQTTKLSYQDVIYVRGKGLSVAAKAGIAAGAVAGFMFLLYAIWYAQGGA